MPVEVTPIIETATEAAVTPPDNDNNSSKNVQETETLAEKSPKNSQQSPKQSETPAPKKRGRPVGVRDKQPRARKQAPPPPVESSSSERPSEEEVEKRPRARKQAPPPPVAASSSSEEEAESAEKATVRFHCALSPRSQHRNTIAQRREQMAVVHQARVSRYTTLLDRMLV